MAARMTYEGRAAAQGGRRHKTGNWQPLGRVAEASGTRWAAMAQASILPRAAGVHPWVRAGLGRIRACRWQAARYQRCVTIACLKKQRPLAYGCRIHCVMHCYHQPESVAACSCGAVELSYSGDFAWRPASVTKASCTTGFLGWHQAT